MKVVIFGATGATGRLAVVEALAAGHQVVAVARSPDKVPPAPGLVVVQGDIGDPASISRVLQGADAVISAVGHVSGSPPDLMKTFATALVPAMKQAGVTRLIVQLGAGVSLAADPPAGFGRRAFIAVMRWFAAAILDDNQAFAEVILVSRLDWTIARPPRLTNGPKTGQTHAAAYLPLGASHSVSRADLAVFLVSQLSEPAFVQQAPMVTGA